MKTPTITLNSGFKMPLLGLGTWESPKGEVGAAVKYALLEAGYDHVDAAAIYENEQEVGAALTEVWAAGRKREDVFITSKLWNTHHHPDNVEAACRQTLADLQLEYLDLYLVHWALAFPLEHFPNSRTGKDGVVIREAIPLQDTWRAMEALVDKGLVRSIGVANYTTTLISDLLAYARIKPAMNQVELHPYLAQSELVRFCQAQGMAVTAYSPLGTPGTAEPDMPRLLDDPAIAAIAANHGKTPAQVLLRAAVQRQTVAIPKSVNPSRILENIQVFDFELSTKELQLIKSLDRHMRYCEPMNWWGLPYFD